MIKSNSRLSLFLIEIIVVVLVFAVSAAICISIFAGAKQKSREAYDTDHAVTCAQSAAESAKAAGFDADTIASLCGGIVSGDTVTVFYDNEWQVVTTDEAYTLTLDISQQDNGLSCAHISVCGDTEIYSLDVAGMMEAAL